MKPPPWNDHRGMARWLDEVLDRQLNEKIAVKQSSETIATFLAELPRMMAEMKAERQRLAQLPPKPRKRGRPPKTRDQRRAASILSMAAHDVERIRSLWAEHYGRRNWVVRRAAKFAAARWHVSETSLRNYLNRSRRARQRID